MEHSHSIHQNIRNEAYVAYWTPDGFIAIPESEAKSRVDHQKRQLEVDVLERELKMALRRIMLMEGWHADLCARVTTLENSLGLGRQETVQTNSGVETDSDFLVDRERLDPPSGD